MKSIRFSLGILAAVLSVDAHAWFFIFPVPNMRPPAQLQKIVDALEKSSETRALASVSEDKTFGNKSWTWGYHSGLISQEEADRVALERCERSLTNAKAQMAGGQLLYDFGQKKCELWPFTPNDGPRRAEEHKKSVAEAEAKQKAEDEQVKVQADEGKTDQNAVPLQQKPDGQ